MNKILLSFALVAMFVSACGSSDDKAKNEKAADSNIVEVTITGNDQMRFDLDKIEVKAGQTVKLTLIHAGQMPKATMGHNWVLLAQGVNLMEFAGAAVGASANDYIPADRAEQVLAHTKMLGGGEKTTIEFTAPAAGEYEFLCSFPGHAALMKGKFIVK